MTTDNRLALIRVKVEWAKKHICDLEVALKRFFDSKPYRIERERDPQTGYNVYRIFDIQPPPVEISLIAGDAIHNLRSALDHLAYQLVYANGATHSKQTAFPIWEKATEYEAQRPRRVKGMAQGAIDAIDATHPYKSGKYMLWVLHELDIADKHHALLVTPINLTKAVVNVPSFFGPGYKGIGGLSFPTFGQPLKDGDIIATREAKMGDDVNFTIDVAFAEPDVIGGQSVLETLQHLSDLVDNLIVSFGEFFT